MRTAAASGLPLSAEVARACGLDVNHFIPKPYTAEMLLAVLRQILNGE